MELCAKSALAPASSPFDCLLFDLDDTLYSAGAGLAQVCRKNIEEFLIRKCGFSPEKAAVLRVELFRAYGSSLAGLRAMGYDIDADEYHRFVHGTLPYEALMPDFRLRSMLQTIPQRKIVFTNSDCAHAGRVLERIGLDGCFDDIICFETMNPNISKSARPDEFPVVLKPSAASMEIAIQVAGHDPRRTLFFDDNLRNVAAGKAHGLRTVLVGKAEKSEEADYALESLASLDQIIPEIWVGGDFVEVREEASEMTGFPRIRSDVEATALATITTVGA